MKKITYITILAVAALGLGGCNDWLDVNPRSQTKESVMFANEDGYKRALTGVYIRMAESGLYGQTMTMYVPETLARNFAVPTSADDPMNRLANFDYQDAGVESTLSSLWQGYYNAIAQTNDVLTHLKGSSVNFRFDNRALIEGEALGLRAFLHFDLLRLFGPVPSAIAGDPVTIPYVTEKTKDAAKLTSKKWSEVTTLIEDNLLEAEKLLRDADPITRFPNEELNNRMLPPLEDDWQMYRQTRFNYYACLGTLARYYQWIGNKTKASQYALMVVDAVNDDGSPKFRLTNEASYVTSQDTNLSMFGEHLFGIENPDLQGIVAPLFKNNPSSLSQTVAKLDEAYEKSTHLADIRYKPVGQPTRYWEERSYPNGSKVNHFRKYTGNDLIAADNRVPLLRLSEMYLILIENLPLAQASGYFTTYRASRSMIAAIDAPSMAGEQSRLARVETEYRKEFFGEGQMFYFYKRHNVPAFTWPTGVLLPEGAYVPPVPKEQLQFE